MDEIKRKIDESEGAVVDPGEQLLAEEIAEKRSGQVRDFSLDLDLDEIPDAEGMKQEDVPSNVDEDEGAMDPHAEDDVAVEEAAPTRSGSGCVSKILFTLIIFAVSCALAAGICVFIFGATGWTGTNEDKEVVIPAGANTQQVAEILKEQDLINDVLCFRIYSRITESDGKWQVGAFTLQSNMGFATIIETLQIAPPRETVTVMLREGLTIDEMAVILEEKGVCSKKDFLDAVMYGDYDYDFLKQIPQNDTDDESSGRVYRLEGYLFPDTYEFFADGLATNVVDKMLKNFQSKLTPDLLKRIEERGWTLDEAVTFASMVQGEGDTRENMDKVSRVLHNRLEPNSGFAKLELCCTRDYANEMAENGHLTFEALHAAYNTYKIEGFPIGPIGNPGMDALLAAVNPSEDEQIMKCYFFATDYKTGITYFSKTLKQHQAIIKKYGITDLG